MNTFTYWFGADAGLRILGVDHDIEIKVRVSYITNGVLEKKVYTRKVEMRDYALYFKLNGTEYAINDFMKDNI